ncbi:hypothetical protein N9058_01200, partial [bacterium]|nr:hypothetical protein [bacterium]
PDDVKEAFNSALAGIIKLIRRNGSEVNFIGGMLNVYWKRAKRKTLPSKLKSVFKFFRGLV